MSKTIPLSGSTKKIIVDDEDYPVLSRLVWYVDSRTSAPVAHVWKNRTVALPIHKLLKPYKINYRLVYADGNPLNNQKENLVHRTATQIIQAADKRQGSSSPYKGVTYSPERKGNQWLARIHRNGKKTFLGYHPTQVDAALAYNQAAIEMYGAGAYQNKIAPPQVDKGDV